MTVPTPLVVRIADELIVFRREDEGPYCVARVGQKGQRRCTEHLAWGLGWSELIAFPGTDRLIEAYPGSFDSDIWLRQRCRSHLLSKRAAPDLLEPEWMRFDPARDADLLRPGLATWTPDGIQDAVALPLDPDVPDFAGLLAEALENAQGLSPAGAPRTTALYRYYDDDDRLLYVGISDTLHNRIGQHVDASSWMEFAVRSTITRYSSREEAGKAETAAIKAEHPLFNHQYNNTPEAQLRLVEYLVEHGRADLLVPAVSRG